MSSVTGRDCVFRTHEGGSDLLCSTYTLLQETRYPYSVRRQTTCGTSPGQACMAKPVGLLLSLNPMNFVRIPFLFAVLRSRVLQSVHIACVPMTPLPLPPMPPSPLPSYVFPSSHTLAHVVQCLIPFPDVLVSELRHNSLLFGHQSEWSSQSAPTNHYLQFQPSPI